MRCPAERLVTDVWARVVPAFGVAGPYRKIEALHRQMSYGSPEIRVTFTNGDSVVSATDRVWEIDQEIDQ